MKRNYALFAGMSRRQLFILFLLPFLTTSLPSTLQSQTIWLENFSGANQGWTDANFTDCDGTAASFNGVQNGRYEVIDMEGAPCCASGGGNDNEWITNPINIAGACNVSISVNYGFIGTFECTPGGPYFGCSGNVAIDNGHDQIVADYRINGGPWIQFGYLCGGGAGVFTASGLTGNTIEIRIRLANKATAETYWFDNVHVQGNLPVVNDPPDVIACSDEEVMVVFAGSPGATFTWENNNTDIGLGASGTGDFTFTTAVVSSQEIGTITVTPVDGTCEGTPVTFTITVNPGPVMDDPGDQIACAGDPVEVIFTGTGNPTYSWTNDNTAIGLGASGTGNLNFPAANVTNTETATITVTPSTPGCPGVPVTFTITVNPLPVINVLANHGTCGGGMIIENFTGTPGAIFSWTNDNPAIGLPASGSGNINFTTTQVTMIEFATVTVTPILGSCEGTPLSFTIMVYPKPIMDDPADQIVCALDFVNVQFSSTFNPLFNWTNNNPAIGLPASGSGNILFLANNVASVQTATITVSPFLDPCTGPPQTFTITVNPAPTVDDPADISTCGGELVQVMFTGTNNATFNWTNSNSLIGLGGTGTGDIDFIAANPATTQTGILSVLPMLGTCFGTPQFFNITVFATPSVNPVNNVSGCTGQMINIPYSGSAGATFSWTNDNPGIGLPASGVSNPINFTATANGTANIVITPDAGGCPGIPETFTITITPGADMNPPADQIACAGDNVMVDFSSPSGNPTYTWTNNNTLIGLGASGTGNLNFTSAAPGGTQTATITVTPQSGGCMGTPQTFDITVSSSPTLSVVPDQIACEGDMITVNFNPSPGAAVSWTNSNPAIGLPATGNGNIDFLPTGPGMAVITATPLLGTCSGPVISFDIIVNAPPTASISGDLSICNGESTTLTASGGGTYQWQGGPATALYTVSPGVTTTYSVTVTSANTCTATASADVVVEPQLMANITGIAAVCEGDNTTLTATGGSTFLWNTGASGSTITVSPSSNTTYSVAVDAPAACPDTAFFTVVVNEPDTVLLSDLTCNPSNTGTFTQNLTNQFGCDSTVITTVTFDPAAIDTTILNATTCDPSQAGIFETQLIGTDGCDSLVITFVIPAPHDQVAIGGSTCDPAQAGTFTQNLTNQYGCDSTIVTTITLLPTDTVAINTATCDPSQTGTFTQNLTNQFGCDSTVITTVTFDPAAIDTTVLNGTTCVPGQAGTSQTLFTGADGCDSLVISIVTLLASDTVTFTAVTCNPSQTGTFTQTLINQNGCDSTVITTVTFDPAAIDTTVLNATTCNAGQAGTSQTLLTGADGCDSLVITIVALLPSDTVALSATTCDPAQTGTFTQNLTNQSGCDSTVVTTVTLLPSDMVTLNATTCDPAQAGTFTQNLTNQSGCDSTVVTTVTLLPSDLLNIDAVTCDPSQAGTFTQNLTNQFGCDSIIVTTIAFNPLDCAPVGQVVSTPPSCGGASDGSFTITATTGQVPMQYTWTGGTGTINALNVPVTETGLTAGNYNITLTDVNGQSITLTTTLTALPGLTVTVSAVNIHNGFTVACSGDSDGSITSTVNTGTAPFTYLWNNGGVASELSDIGPGVYSLTVTDGNGCTGIGSAEATAPPALSLEVEADEPLCGDVTLGGLATYSGGVPPLQVFVNNQPQSGSNLNLVDGSNTVSVQDANGCVYDTVIAVSLPPVPQVQLPGDASVVLGESISVEAIVNIAVWDTLIWTPLPDPACAGCPVQVFQPVENMTLAVTLIDTAGCLDTAEMRILVEQKADIFVPNVFSPNDDGREDFFMVNAGPSVVEIQEIAIFDRWGDKVYEWKTAIPPNGWQGWDGAARGKDANPGVFVYYFKIKLADGTTRVVDGDVSLIR